jgi:hypothetical protein
MHILSTKPTPAEAKTLNLNLVMPFTPGENPLFRNSIKFFASDNLSISLLMVEDLIH